MVDEVGYIQNDIRITRGGEESYSGRFVFRRSDQLNDEGETLTVTIVLHLTFSK